MKEKLSGDHPLIYYRPMGGTGTTSPTLKQEGIQDRIGNDEDSTGQRFCAPRLVNKNVQLRSPKLEKAMARTGWTMASGSQSPRKVRA